MHAGHQANARREELLVEVRATVRGHLREVVTGGKRGAATFDHEYARRFVGRNGVERAQHLDHDLVRERIATLRSVQHEAGNDVVAFELDVVPRGRHGSEANGEFA